MLRSATCSELWQKLEAHELATPNVGLVSDIIACPGLDYCSLANARSIPVAQELTRALPRPRAGAHHRPPAHQHFRLHQCLRPPPCRPHRHSRRREERRGVLPDHARRPRRRGRQARHAARAGGALRRGRRRRRGRGRGLCRAARRGPRNCSSTPSSGSASSHSRSVSMPLVKSGRIVEDQFVRIADDAPVPDGVAVIVSGARFLADAEALAQRDGGGRRDVAEQPADRRAGAAISSGSRWSRWCSRASVTAAPTARRASCASATASAASCAPPARCCATSSCSCCAPASIRSRCRRKPMPRRLRRASRRFDVFYQPTGDGRATAFRRRLGRPLQASNARRVSVPRCSTVAARCMRAHAL